MNVRRVCAETFLGGMLLAIVFGLYLLFKIFKDAFEWNFTPSFPHIPFLFIAYWTCIVAAILFVCWVVGRIVYSTGVMDEEKNNSGVDVE